MSTGAVDWFIDPTDTVKLELDIPGAKAGEAWILVKRELSFAEEAALSGAMIGRFQPSGEKKRGKSDLTDSGIEVDLKKFEIERIMSWVVEWSAAGPGGKMLPVTRDAIASLRPSIAAAITAALDAHVEAMASGKAATSGETTG